MVDRIRGDHTEGGDKDHDYFEAKPLNVVGTATLIPYLRQPSGRLKVDDFAESLIELLPTYYQDGFVVRAVQEAIGQEYATAFAMVDETLDQAFVSRATWGLALWERLLGLPVQDDEGEGSYEHRRGIILAALRGRSLGSEFAFKQLLEDVLGEEVVINPYEPAIKPYTIEIESLAQIVEDAPFTPIMANIEGSAGNVQGTYIYKITYVFPTGETDAGQSESNPVSASGEKVILSNLPRSQSEHAVARKVYRRHYLEPTFKFIGDIQNNTETTFIDNVANNVSQAAHDLSEFNSAYNQVGLRVMDIIQKAKPAHIHVEFRGSAFRASINAAGDRV